VAALGTNFNPLDPSLDDILKPNTRSTTYAQSKGGWWGRGGGEARKAEWGAWVGRGPQAAGHRPWALTGAPTRPQATQCLPTSTAQSPLQALTCVCVSLPPPTITTVTPTDPSGRGRHRGNR
jgi:hypothetical protein